MARSIKLKYDGKTYDLTFTRETVKRAEDSGFDLRVFAMNSKPATMNPLLFYCAFMAKQPKIRRKVVDDIYEHIHNKQQLTEALAEIYADTLAPLVEDDESAEADDEKKVEWDLV